MAKKIFQGFFIIAMKITDINSLKNHTAFKSHLNAGRKIAKTFAKMDGIGEGASIAFDFLGKAVVVPAVIMLSSKEPKEKKEYSAFKNPVAAVIQLLLEVPILYFGSKAIENAANKGVFDNDEKRLYNEKFFKDKFVSSLNDTVKNNTDIKDGADKIINSLNNKGLTKKIGENIENLIKTMPEETGKLIGQNYDKYKNVHRNLFHLQNRLCFIAAIVMTPILCALENKLHPVIMDKIYEKENVNAHKKAAGLAPATQNQKINHNISIHAFIDHIRRHK